MVDAASGDSNGGVKDSSSSASPPPSSSSNANRFTLMKVSELRDELRKKGLPPNGMRGQLIDRLVKAESGVSVDSQPPSKQAETIVNAPQPVVSNASSVAREEESTRESEVDVPSYDDDDEEEEEEKPPDTSVKTATSTDMELRAVCFRTIKNRVPISQTRFVDGISLRIDPNNLEYVYFDASKLSGFIIAKNISDIPLITHILVNEPDFYINPKPSSIPYTFKVVPIPVGKVRDMILELSNSLHPKMIDLSGSSPRIVERPYQKQQQQQQQPYSRRQYEPRWEDSRQDQRESESRWEDSRREPESAPGDVWSQFQHRDNEQEQRGPYQFNNNHSMSPNNHHSNKRNGPPSSSDDAMYNHPRRRRDSWSTVPGIGRPPDKRIRTEYGRPLPPQEKIAPFEQQTSSTNVENGEFDESQPPQTTKSQPSIKFQPVSNNCKERRLNDKNFIYRPILSHDDYMQRQQYHYNNAQGRDRERDRDQGQGPVPAGSKFW